MPLENVKIKRTPIKIGGKERFFLFNFRASAILAEKFGNAIKAQDSLNRSCFKIEDGHLVGKSAEELMTKDFFEVISAYVEALLSQDIKEGGDAVDFYDLEMDELEPISKAIFTAIGMGAPDQEVVKKKTPRKR